MAIETITIKDAANVDQAVTVDSTASGKTQIVKVGYGVDGTDPTMVSSSNPLPVALSGAQAVSGTVAVSNLPATQPVSGTITAVTAITNALPAGANNIGDVDVLTVPTDPFGANADAAVAAGAVGSIQAKLRRLTTDIDAIKTSVAAATPAGTNNIGDVDVLTLPAIPAGTNNIGDVDVLTLPSIPAGTNNIGDVDVLTMPNITLTAGEFHLGEIGGNTRIVRPSLTVTAGAYTAGDVISARQTLTNAVRISSGTGVLQDITIICADGEKPDCTVVLFDSATASNLADNAAFAWGAGDQAKFLCMIPILSTEWVTLGGQGVLHKQNIGAVVVANGSQNLYGYLIATGTPSFSATTDVSIAYKFLDD